MLYSSFLPVTEAGRAADTLPASSSYLVRRGIRASSILAWLSLSDVLYHGANSAVVRQQAGVQLKNFLYTNDESLRAQYEERWLAMPEDVRLYTKQNVLGTLGTENFRPSAAAQCLQLIAMVELPRGLWPNLLP